MFDTLVTDLREGDNIRLPDDEDVCEVMGVHRTKDGVDLVLFDPDIDGNTLVRMKFDDKVELIRRSSNDNNQ